MDLISLIVLVVIGFLAGWIASALTGRRNSALINIILGIVGAAVGNFLFRSLGFFSYGFISSLISATVGALLIIIVAQALMGKPRMRL
jgi:uncharacterized membrane protein YeaQ/YmgE (transglycosylase-associated protein family)